jgi:Protein of unknown function (DUF669)
MSSDCDQQVAPDESASYDLMPRGKYVCHFTAQAVVELKSGNGQCLKLDAQVLEGPHKGRKLWVRLNVSHTSETAQRISQQQLSKIKGCFGLVGKLSDASLLLFKPITLSVDVAPARGGYAESNEVKDFSPVGKIVPMAHAPAPAQAPLAQTGSSSGGDAPTPPWMKRA